MYYCIWVDDERSIPKDLTALKSGEPYAVWATTTNDAVKAVRRKYKEGVRNFMLDLDNDTEDMLKNEHGGEFYNVLKQLEYYIHSGRIKDANFLVRIHTGNSVARQHMKDFIEYNPCFEEIL